MKRFLSIILVLVCGFSMLSAQGYNTAVGVRAGTDWGLTVQQRVGKKFSVEGIIHSSFGGNNVLGTALIERHVSFIGIKKLNFYGGIGLHKGWITGENTENVKNPFGTTFIGGAEVTFGKINISYDYKPRLNFTGGEKRFESETALSVRYVLWERPGMVDRIKKKRKKKKRQKAKAKKKKQKEKSKNKDSKGGIFDIFKKD